MLSRAFIAKPRSLPQIWLESIGLGILFFVLFGVLLHELVFGLAFGVILAVGRGTIQVLYQRRQNRD